MIFRVAISSIIYLICSFTSRSQEIYVGQTLPEITLTGVLNYHSDTMKIADLKRKLIILDFWNHHCTSCLESFPKLDSLQRLFKDQIQIILVNRESKNSTIEFFRKKRLVKSKNKQNG